MPQKQSFFVERIAALNFMPHRSDNCKYCANIQNYSLRSTSSLASSRLLIIYLLLSSLVGGGVLSSSQVTSILNSTTRLYSNSFASEEVDNIRQLKFNDEDNDNADENYQVRDQEYISTKVLFFKESLSTSIYAALFPTSIHKVGAIYNNDHDHHLLKRGI